MNAVILANGKFPEHLIPLSKLFAAKTLVCCDGAIEHLDNLSITPTVLIGDLDSVNGRLKAKYQQIILHDPDQYTNDLTKAVKWCVDKKIKTVVIVGATGKREDHTLGNIGLLVKYANMGVDCEMITDTGVIKPYLKSVRLKSFVGQQVSIFSSNNSTVISTKNLMYPIENRSIPEWWMGTLNESLGDWFELNFEPGPLVVYQMF
ncbi:MAG TPA: thiamine diphosphokinase [Tenuifilaceae bacterium]|nr:thiamine diphosphokinase [Tenuifilaceae bacterium]